MNPTYKSKYGTVYQGDCLEIMPIKKEETYEWLLYKHYAHRIPSITHAFGLYNQKILIGVCVYGMPPCKMNEGKAVFRNIKVGTFELTRLVVNENLGKNTLSFFVSHTIKKMPSYCLLVSFADPNKFHHGYIYQATNWLYTGLTVKGGKDKQWIWNNREFHAKTITIEWMKKNRFNYDSSLNMTQNWINNGGTVEENIFRKHRYIYLRGTKKQKKAMLKDLKYKILPYPKGDNKRYDTSYKPVTQGRLF